MEFMQVVTALSALLGVISITCVIVINVRTIKRTSPAVEQARTLAEWQKGVDERLDKDHTRLKLLEKHISDQQHFEKLMLRSIKGILHIIPSSENADPAQITKLVDEIDHYLIER